MFRVESRPAVRCADSPAVRSDDPESVGENFESQNEITSVVIFQLEHAQLVGHELEDNVIARQLDVVTMKMEFAFLFAHDANASG